MRRCTSRRERAGIGCSWRGVRRPEGRAHSLVVLVRDLGSRRLRHRSLALNQQAANLPLRMVRYLPQELNLASFLDGNWNALVEQGPVSRKGRQAVAAADDSRQVERIRR